MNKNFISLLFAARKARRNKAFLQKVQRERLSQIVAYARKNSGFYSQYYDRVPGIVTDVTVLPVTEKKMLMAKFNDWCTDGSVTVEIARQFANAPELIGEKFRGKYTLATTSGTSGFPGMFLLDEFSMKVTNAMALRMLSSWLNISDVLQIAKGKARLAMVMATGGHFASAIAASRLSKTRGEEFLALSAHRPIEELVQKLNEFQPVILAPYASMAALLASEQEARKLHINPVITVLSAEGLAEGEYKRIAKAFNSKVHNSYAATECPFFSYSCNEGWLHVNNDWVLFEAVDANHRPVAPGEESYTVLITNLANRIQPILRYDLGDSILLRPDPCPCGNMLPAIRVKGRSSDVLTFPRGNEKVSILPLAFSILVDHIPGIIKVQIVQTSTNLLRVRAIYEDGIDKDHVWEQVYRTISSLLADRGLKDVKIERANEPPEQTSGGKYRVVIPLRG